MIGGMSIRGLSISLLLSLVSPCLKFCKGASWIKFKLSNHFSKDKSPSFNTWLYVFFCLFQYFLNLNCLFPFWQRPIFFGNWVIVELCESGWTRNHNHVLLQDVATSHTHSRILGYKWHVERYFKSFQYSSNTAAVYANHCLHSLS